MNIKNRVYSFFFVMTSKVLLNISKTTNFAYYNDKYSKI